MNPDIIERIERCTGIPKLAEILAKKLSPGDLQSLLLAVYSLKTEEIRPWVLLERYAESRFTGSSAIGPQELRQLSLQSLLLPFCRGLSFGVAVFHPEEGEIASPIGQQLRDTG